VSERPNLTVVIASTRPSRKGEPIARWFVELARAHGGFDVALVDLAEVNLPIYNEPQQPVTGEYAYEHTRRWSSLINNADAFVFVMPEYNFSFNAAIKNALDYLYREWRYKPVGLVGYGGGANGTRSIQALKPVLLALKLFWAGDVAIGLGANPVVDGAFAGSELLEKSAHAMLNELARLEGALKVLRPEQTS